ncbi:hypothetical protein BpHYR1_031946 [Brachionus plicatilis]|uniref:Uncharacterized protein n=1 Tax=Brachionus plicatilis TaxID=10195 RepID=A0A3M7T6S0_BRAPC|nr:hypothetical protein BpHYR1_031946 [Brachionus plicatilis]
MTFFIENITSILCIFLISTQQINDLHFEYFKFENSKIIIEKDSAKNESNHGERATESVMSSTNSRFNHSAYSTTLISCGHFANWKAPNNSYSVLSPETYKKLLSTRSSITNTLNQIKLGLKKKNIINIVQEKKLGKNGNSYHYQKSVKKLDIADNIYVSFEQKPELSPLYFNPNKSNCDYLELTLYDSATNFMVRRTVNHEFIDSIKRDFYYRKSNICSVSDTHPILEHLKMTKPKNSPLKKKIYQRLLKKQHDFRFHFRYNLDKMKEINILLKTYLKLASAQEDFVLSYAILQKRSTGELFMHLKTNSGVVYLNILEIFPNNPDNFIFKFKQSSSLTFRIKSLELWNILRYEIYVPQRNCSEFLDVQSCQNEEEALIELLERRDSVRKYNKVFTNLFSNNEEIDDLYKCVFLEYFGKIFTCNGKVISAAEYGLLKNRDLYFQGLVLMIKIDSVN